MAWAPWLTVARRAVARAELRLYGHAARTNRAVLPRLGPEPASGWRSDEGLGVASAIEALPQRPDWLVVVTTYERPEGFARVEAALAPQLADARCALVVLNDRGTRSYGEVRDAARRRWGARLSWLDALERHGKQGFWRTHQTAFTVAERLRPQRLLVLQDDLVLAPDFVAAADRVWASLADDPRRLVLYLMSSPDDEPLGRWVRFSRRELVGKQARLTQWFDLQGYLADARFLELMRHRVLPVPRARWALDPTLSSGVGEQFSLRCFGRGNIYQAHPSLVGHGSAPSEMNPEARRLRPLEVRTR